MIVTLIAAIFIVIVAKIAQLSLELIFVITARKKFVRDYLHCLAHFLEDIELKIFNFHFQIYWKNLTSHEQFVRAL